MAQPLRTLTVLPKILYCHSKPLGTAALARMLSSVPPCIAGIFLKVSGFTIESPIEKWGFKRCQLEGGRHCSRKYQAMSLSVPLP